jgi:DNA-binding transcriptional MerR regulator
MTPDAPEIPEKLFYKIGEVCQYTDTQPYVLRFWESEFPQLSPQKNRSGQRTYSRQDIDLILRIKSLLYEEEYTIAGARKRLEQEVDGGEAGERRGGTRRRARGKQAKKRGKAGVADRREEAGAGDAGTGVDDPIREMERLRKRVVEVEERWRRAETALEEAERASDVYRERCERAAARLESLLGRIGGAGPESDAGG